MKARRNRQVKITKEFALAKCNYFVDVQLWPTHSDLDPEGWLSNFEPDEMEHAIHLLYSFLYYSEQLVNEMFIAAFRSLSTDISKNDPNKINLRHSWRKFINEVVITYVTGETPSVTDSGYVFARKARQLLGIPETRIMSPDNVLDDLYINGTKPVVFVDDFVGSGDQFITTWERTKSLSSSAQVSFEKVYQLSHTRFYYCPLICTQHGFNNISYSCPDVRLKPGNIISSKYSLISADSIIWPKELLSNAEEILQKASVRAGINVNSWKGHNDLALALAFYHSIPDATLPIIYWNENGWKPLINRT